MQIFSRQGRSKKIPVIQILASFWILLKNPQFQTMKKKAKEQIYLMNLRFFFNLADEQKHVFFYPFPSYTVHDFVFSLKMDP